MIDILILLLIAAGMVKGYMSGFIRQLLSIAGLIVGLFAANALYMPLAGELCPAVTESRTLAQVLAFIGIWIAVPLLFALGASILTRLLEAVSLGWLNRSLGCAFGALKMLLVVMLAIWVLGIIDTDNSLIRETKKSESLFYYRIEALAGMLLPTAKEITYQYISNNATRRTQ